MDKRDGSGIRLQGIVLSPLKTIGLSGQLFANIIDGLRDFVDDRSDFLHGDVEIVKGLDFTFK